jgi:hypothetical protein
VPGYSIGRADLDNRMGALISALRTDLQNIVEFKALLDDTTILPDSVLQAAPFSYSSADTTLIRAAFADLKKLSDISNNLATQSATNDFWFSAKHLTGIATP